MSHVKEGTVGVQELAEEQGGSFLHRKGMDSLYSKYVIIGGSGGGRSSQSVIQIVFRKEKERSGESWSEAEMYPHSYII
jgi:hypothetical protein